MNFVRRFDRASECCCSRRRRHRRHRAGTLCRLSQIIVKCILRLHRWRSRRRECSQRLLRNTGTRHTTQSHTSSSSSSFENTFTRGSRNRRSLTKTTIALAQDFVASTSQESSCDDATHSHGSLLLENGIQMQVIIAHEINGLQRELSPASSSTFHDVYLIRCARMHSALL